MLVVEMHNFGSIKKKKKSLKSLYWTSHAFQHFEAEIKDTTKPDPYVKFSVKFYFILAKIKLLAKISQLKSKIILQCHSMYFKII